MSAHIAICGLTGEQRVLFEKYKKLRDSGDEQKTISAQAISIKNPFLDYTSPNSLVEAHKLHCQSSKVEMKKSTRDIFVKGTKEDVLEDFENLMSYCATDVLATAELFAALLGKFLSSLRHPVTMAGMLEMGTTYLPVNQHWQTYIKTADAQCDELSSKNEKLIVELAVENLKLLADDKYKTDPWFWSESWNVAQLKAHPMHTYESSEDYFRRVSLKLKEGSKKVSAWYGYPEWFRNMCPRPCELDSLEGTPTPQNFTVRMFVIPKLLRMSYLGYPLHHERNHGWGYLVPDEKLYNQQMKDLEKEEQLLNALGKEEGVKEKLEKLRKKKPRMDVPYEAIKKVVESWDPSVHCTKLVSFHQEMHDKARTENLSPYNMRDMESLVQGLNDIEAATTQYDAQSLLHVQQALEHMSLADRERVATLAKDLRQEEAELRERITAKARVKKDNGYVRDVHLLGCHFWKLPHEKGFGSNVGCPIGEPFHYLMEQGKLASADPSHCISLMQTTKMTSYWRNNRDRIKDQLSIYFKPEEFHPSVTLKLSSEGEGEKATNRIGAILPQLVVAGTVTRRGTEKTWLTAANVFEDRLGSELNAMIQAPPGWSFVGADVDSEELWIAAVLGDQYEQPRMHGSTPLGWMVLQGSKAEGTDQHSVVATRFGITRDQAKILNYSRLYGAGELFTIKQLMNFNPTLSQAEAAAQTRDLFVFTKGDKAWLIHKNRQDELNSMGEMKNGSLIVPFEALKSHAKEVKINVSEFGRVIHFGGTDSASFNAIDNFSCENRPRTPVLSAKISTTLEPRLVADRYAMTRNNWVVQSSAADYLHLLLSSMRELCDRFGILARLALTVHDSVYYLVREEDKYRAALALQVANLYTRSMFAYQLGFDNLPASVAFFSEVNVDVAMRKDATKPYTTPSNPHGLKETYGVPDGENLTIDLLLEKCDGLGLER